MSLKTGTFGITVLELHTAGDITSLERERETRLSCLRPDQTQPLRPGSENERCNLRGFFTRLLLLGRQRESPGCL